MKEETLVPTGTKNDPCHYYNEALTHEQIALRLGLHRATVARRLHAAETLLLALARQDMRDNNW
ncbi:MAG: hypothetical protein K8I27_08085 [Planctomycetes bacterium]|nr:hypothetical protein [Planctomycetota bacterium]